jgi:hypothetical protein
MKIKGIKKELRSKSVFLVKPLHNPPRTILTKRSARQDIPVSLLTKANGNVNVKENTIEAWG